MFGELGRQRSAVVIGHRAIVVITDTDPHRRSLPPLRAQRLFGRPDDHPEWCAQNSPHHFVADISTPILLSHGSRDYRVPVSESMRCWWDLVDAWDGDPDDLPHRFLQFTGENHWVLTPSNAQIWWHTVLGFCGHHVRGDDWTPSELLP